VRVENLSAAAAKDSALLEKHPGRYAHTADNPFVALNQAFFSDGAFIFGPKGVEVAEPLQLVYISSATQNGETIQPRKHIIAEANSKVIVVERDLITTTAIYFPQTV